MNIPKTPRYGRTVLFTLDFLIEESITDFPVDPFSIIKNNNWGLVKYSEFAKFQGKTLREVIKGFQSEDGWVYFDGKHYTIYYNDKKTPPDRIRFTLMHEIGHIYLGHLTDFSETALKRGGLSKQKYEVLEDEANAFARNVLAPAPIVKKLRLRTPQDLITAFSITCSAALTRLGLLRIDLKHAKNFSRYLIDYFKHFIDSFSNRWDCPNCLHTFIDKKPNYCPICKNSELFKNIGGGIGMIYSKIKLDDSHRAVRCPKCDNEDIIGDYCQICGSYLVNKCTGFNDRPDNDNRHNGPWHQLELSCGELLPGEARFCTSCGSTSTFYESGLLKSWESEQGIEAAATSDPFGDSGVSEISDEDLPF